MKKKDTREVVAELTMMLLYLTRFTEKEKFYEDENLSWKGYPFLVLNKFADEGLIGQGKHPSRSKRVWIRPEGIDYARKLLEKYEIEDWGKE